MYRILLILFAVSLIFSQIPQIDSELLKKYRSISETRENQIQAEDVYSQTEVQTEDSIDVDIAQETPDIKKERELGTFVQPVIVNDDTVQTLIKALPRELVFYGSDLFDNDFDNQVVTTNIISQDYVLGAGDILLLNIWGDVNANYELTVDSEGKIFIPKAGEILIAGNSIRQAEIRLRRLMSRIYTNFQISLSLKKIKNIKVYVIGEVKRPGSYFMSGLSNTFNALDFAGGPNDIGSYRDIRIIRNKETVATIDLYEFLSKGTAAGNINLTTNDIIFVPPRKSSVKLRGAVLNPGKFEITEDQTIAQLLELAGGLMPEASEKTINIDRAKGATYATVSIDMSDTSSQNTPLIDGDDISVFTKPILRRNTVFARGHISREGSYAFDSTMTVKQFFIEHNLLLEDTYRERVDIIRTTEENEKVLIPVNLNLALSDDPRHNIKFKDRDLVLVFSIWNFREKETVEIRGNVRKPGSYPLFKGMTVQDLVFIAGGLDQNASMDLAELTRVTDTQNPESFILKIEEAIEERNSPENMHLMNSDILFIRSNPHKKTHRIVEITGEVLYPGEYAMLSESEKLSSLIERAGGFKESAFPQGALFERNDISERMEQRNLRDILSKTMPIEYDSLGRQISIDYSFKNLNRIIIDISGLEKGDKVNDIILEHGDKIHIPNAPSGVSVKGAVAFEGTIKFNEKEKMRYYVEAAGGLLRNADRSEIRIVKYNGKTLKVKMGYSNIEPGDIIIVPFEKIDKKDYMSIIMNTASILSSLATTLYILIKLQ